MNIRSPGLVCMLLLPMLAFAMTPEEKGLAIAQEADRRDTGFVDTTSELNMTLLNAHGDVSERKMRTKTLEVHGDGDKSLTIFDHPADVKGTAFLSYTHALEPDDQWLFLPALKRVKRISSKNKSGPFMGSEFAYEDMSSQEVEKYTYRYLRDETLEGEACFVIERIPQYEYSGYTRQVVWLSQSKYQPMQIEFYDRKDALLKTLKQTGYQQYKNKFWRPDRMHMINHQTQKETILEWSNYQFETGLTDRDFDKASLKRAR